MARYVPRAFSLLLSLIHADPYGDLLETRTQERFRKIASPRYLVSKLRVTLYEKRHPDHPWLTRDAIALIDQHLRPDHRGLEWGSGNGTRWFATRARSLVSIEHDRGWYDTVRVQLESQGARNVDSRFAEEDRYAAVIDEFEDEVFDFIVVDGLFRGATFLKSIPKLKPGGWIIFDNANWYLPSDSKTPHSRSHRDGPESPEFARVAELVRGWHVTWTTNGVNDTAIYVKPSAVR